MNPSLSDTNLSPSSLAGKTLLVTGAGDGLGRYTALACARAGATVILLSKTVRKLEKVYDEIVATGAPQPAIYPLNLEGAGPDDYQQLANSIAKEFGHLDGLIHCAAALGVLSPVSQYDIKTWFQVQQVNLNGPFLLTRACLPLLAKSSAGSLLFTGDRVGREAKAFWGAYAVSKAGLETLAEMLSLELENSPVRIHLVYPGPMRTQLRMKAYPGEDPNKHPLPADMAGAYVRLIGRQAGTPALRVDLRAIPSQ